MSQQSYFYQPSQGHGLPHDPFNAIIAPRPIGWISSQDDKGNVNLAPYSFFNAFNYHPPIIGFSSIGYKDTVRNIEQTKVFCWNLATVSLAQAMNNSSAAVAPNVDEFELAGLEKSASQCINVPRVAQSPVSMECKLSQIIQLASASGEKVDSWLILGEVVGVHIAQSALIEGVFDTAAIEPLLRGGGPADYFTINASQKIEMFRPR